MVDTIKKKKKKKKGKFPSSNKPPFSIIGYTYTCRRWKMPMEQHVNWYAVMEELIRLLTLFKVLLM